MLQLGSLAALELTLAEVPGQASPFKAAPSSGRARACLVIYLFGGPSQLDTFDLKPDAPDQFRGEFHPIATDVPGI